LARRATIGIVCGFELFAFEKGHYRFLLGRLGSFAETAHHIHKKCFWHEQENIFVSGSNNEQYLVVAKEASDGFSIPSDNSAPNPDCGGMNWADADRAPTAVGWDGLAGLAAVLSSCEGKGDHGSVAASSAVSLPVESRYWAGTSRPDSCISGSMVGSSTTTPSTPGGGGGSETLPSTPGGGGGGLWACSLSGAVAQVVAASAASVSIILSVVVADSLNFCWEKWLCGINWEEWTTSGLCWKKICQEIEEEKIWHHHTTQLERHTSQQSVQFNADLVKIASSISPKPTEAIAKVLRTNSKASELESLGSQYKISNDGWACHEKYI
jgi:hypothetical protein